MIFASRQMMSALATICWFHELSALLNTERTVDVQRAVEPVGDAKALTVRKRWSCYKAGRHQPRERLLVQAEARVPGTRWVMDSLLWEALRVDNCERSIALRLQGRTSREGDELLQRMLNCRAHRWDRRWIRKRCESMIRVGGLNGLAVLLVCMRLARTVGHSSLNLAFELYVNDGLLAFGVWFNRRGVADVLSTYYENEFLPLYGSDLLRYKFDSSTFAYSIANYEKSQAKVEAEIGRPLTLQEQATEIYRSLNL